MRVGSAIKKKLWLWVAKKSKEFGIVLGGKREIFVFPNSIFLFFRNHDCSVEPCFHSGADSKSAIALIKEVGRP
jgi:hypothetical protein